MFYAIEIIIILVVCAIIGITLLLNTKSEGLGAAITGGSDSYRGAVGAEEQKRNLLRLAGYSFLGLSLLHALMHKFF